MIAHGGVNSVCVDRINNCERGRGCHEREKYIIKNCRQLGQSDMYDRVILGISNNFFAGAIDGVEYCDLKDSLVKIYPAIGHVASPQRSKTLLLGCFCFRSYGTFQKVEDGREFLGPQRIGDLSLSNYSPSFEGREKGLGGDVGDSISKQLLFEFPLIGSGWEIFGIGYGASLLGIHYQKQQTNLFNSNPNPHTNDANYFVVGLAVIIYPMNTDKQQQKRIIDSHAQTLSQTIKSLEDQIELTVYNYENILVTEKKNSSDRSEFLLYLIQSLRMRHNQQINNLNSDLQAAVGEREQAQEMQKQMENIGDGLDQIMQESRRIKSQNQNLQKQLEDQQLRDKELDQEIYNSKKQLDQCRLKVDEWERIKIKWNRKKKELMEMIEEAEKTSSDRRRPSLNAESVQDNDHKERNKIEQLYRKYNGDYEGSS